MQIFQFYLQNLNENEKFVRIKQKVIKRNSLIGTRLLLALSIFLCLLPAFTSATASCRHHEYWDAEIDECVPCTKCNRHQIVIRPCQRHIDTVCRPINSIEIDWTKSMAAAEELNLRNQLDDFEPQPQAAASSTSREDQNIILWDWQMIFLTLAIIACCLFFLVTTIISINYVRQWRKIKKQFDTGEL